MAEEKEKPLTREDVIRKIEENGGKTVGLDLSNKEFEEGIDLSKLDLRGIIIKGFLIGAHLEGANLVAAHVNGILKDAHFEGACLVFTHFEGAFLGITHFEGADLTGAHLERADLTGAHLEGAYLRGAEFSPETRLEEADWGSYILGEEKDGNFDSAADIYRRLKQWHQEHGMYDIAAKFYYREKEAARKGAKRRRDHVAGWLSWAFFGHGERWRRILIWIAAVVFGLAAAYYFWGSFSSSSFWDTLYYSAASFSALGYGNWAPQPTGWAKGMGAAEAIIGVFMMALLLVTFVRKWTR